MLNNQLRDNSTRLFRGHGANQLVAPFLFIQGVPMFKRFMLLLLCSWLFGACQTVNVYYEYPTPTPTTEVTEEATATVEVLPTLAPITVTLPSLPTNTGLPTSTTRPTSTNTPRPTNTNTPTPTIRPTNTAVPTPTTQPVNQAIPLDAGCEPFFYNVNGVGLGDRPELERHHEVLNPCGATVMDNMGLAYWMAERGTIVAVRTYSSQEGSQCLTDDPVQQIRRFAAEIQSFPQNVKNHLYYYGCSNEPSYGQNWQVTAILDAEIRMMTEANRLGVHVCSGNWGVGNFDPNHVDSGLYDNYLRTIIGGNHLLCVHEYTSLTLAFGVGLTLSREDLLHPERVQKNNWARPEQVVPQRIQLPVMAQSADMPFGYEEMWDYYTQPTAQAVNGVLPPYWHLFRVYWLFIRARELGLSYPYVMITEGLHDHLDDINRQEPRALQILDDAWGIAVYDGDLRGVPAHCRLWEQFYYPQWSCEEAYLQQLLWWKSIRDSHIISVNVFTWTYNDMWKSFNLSNRQMQAGNTFDVFDFRRRLEACVLADCQFQY